ncbi:MAG: zeta toxin family protein [Planctomycetaceae bacterium]
MPNSPPHVVLIAGPNGAGKSTCAPDLLRDHFQIREFVNADVIAEGLSAFDVEAVAMEAGRIMLQRIAELSKHRVSFAFETTLASRSFASLLRQLRKTGYQTHMLFFWLPSPEFAIARVQTRVASGGHHVPDVIVRRRYVRGLSNFMNLYRPLLNTWQLFDATRKMETNRIARFDSGDLEVINESLWRIILESK